MRRALPILAIALFAPALAPAQAPAAIKSIWGPPVLPNGSSAFPVYKQLRADDLQVVVNWARAAPSARPSDPTNPNDPAYSWPAEVDLAVAQARRAGMDVSVMLTHTPPWANGGRPEVWAPDNPQDFADFAMAASRRYPSVKRWMIWGEPNRPEQFLPLPRGKPEGPRRYALILDAAYAALKRVSARDQVIGAMTFTAGHVLPATWLRFMKLPNGRRPRLDMWGHNPFSTRFPSLRGKPIFGNNRDFNDLDTFYREIRRAYRRTSRKFARSGPKLWLSEFTIQSDHRSNEFNFFVSRREQARWVAAAYKVANENRFIAGLGWIQLLDEPARPDNLEGRLGLLTYDLRPKPSFTAYRKAR